MVQGYAKEDNTSSSFGCSLSDRIGSKSLYIPSSGADEYWFWREVRMLEQQSLRRRVNTPQGVT